MTHVLWVLVFCCLFAHPQENARLSAALEAAHRDAERREQQSLADFRDIRQSFSRFQQLHINAVAPRQHHDGAAARTPVEVPCFGCSLADVCWRVLSLPLPVFRGFLLLPLPAVCSFRSPQARRVPC